MKSIKDLRDALRKTVNATTQTNEEGDMRHLLGLAQGLSWGMSEEGPDIETLIQDIQGGKYQKEKGESNNDTTIQ